MLEHTERDSWFRKRLDELLRLNKYYNNYNRFMFEELMDSIDDNRKTILKNLSEIGAKGGQILFSDGSIFNFGWVTKEELENISNSCIHDEECDCEECSKPTNETDGSVVIGPDEQDSNIPPARYYVVAGGNGYWCTDIKINALGVGMDVIWIQKINGKDVTVMGTLYDVNISVFDYETEMTVEKFANIKKQQFDYVMQKAKEAGAEKSECNDPANGNGRSSSNDSIPPNKSATDSVMKSYG